MIDHSLPQNCGTFYDGCHCAETIKFLEAEIERQRGIIHWFGAFIRDCGHQSDFDEWYARVSAIDIGGAT